MVMRVASLCVLLACASGVSLSHKAATGPKVQQSIGQTLLLEVQQKLDAGLPVDELERIIGQVKDRITLAQAADDKQHTQRQENCTIDKATYTANINEALQKITETKAAINAAEAEYDRLTAKAAELEKLIEEKDKEVEAKMIQIETNRKVRAEEHAAFVNRSTDTTSVIAAVEEIRGFKFGSTLKELFPDADEAHTASVNDQVAQTEADFGLHQDEDKDTEEAADVAHKATNAAVIANTTGGIVEDSRYHTIDTYKLESNEAFIQLSALSKKCSDPSTRSLLEMAAKDVSVLQNDDQAQLFKLFDELLEMLRAETDKNIVAEKAAAINHVRMENLFTDELRAMQLEKHTMQDELQATYRDKRTQAALIASLRDTLDEWVQKRDDNRKMLADRTAECDLFRQEYNTRSSERTQELKTLAEITRILKDKIKTVLDDNERVKGSIRRTAAPTPAP